MILDKSSVSNLSNVSNLSRKLGCYDDKRP
jgi:hypothetical protein